MPADYLTTARALSLSPNPGSPSLEQRPSWTRTRRTSSLRLSTMPTRAPKSGRTRITTALVQIGQALAQTGQTLFHAYMFLSPLYRILVFLGLVCLTALTITFLIYSHAIFTWLSPVAEAWRQAPGGWLIMWFIVFVSAFPPMIGYSTANTVAGFIFGFPLGWPIVATACTVGSLAAFMASRTILSTYVHNLVGKDHRFLALGQVLKRDGLGMLTMIRFCPLPFSLSNGFLATIPSITPLSFTLSTAFAR